MPYALRRQILGEGEGVAISEERFGELKDARSLQFAALSIEEKFDLVVENYLATELELLSRALSGAARAMAAVGWPGVMADYHRYTRAIVNLLTTCRLYIDHAPHALSFGRADIGELASAFKVECSKQYDDSLGYRFMEALRNFVQHRGWPVHSMVRKSSRVEVEGSIRIGHVVVPMTDVGELERDGKFKQAVLEEVAKQGERIDIRPFVREYVAGLAKVNAWVGDHMSDALAQSESLVEEANADYRSAFGDDLVGLAAEQTDETGAVIDTVPLFEGPEKRRGDLARRNRAVMHCDKHFVTNADFSLPQSLPSRPDPAR